MNSENDLFAVTKWLMIVAGTWEIELVGASEKCKKIYKAYSYIIWIIYHTSQVSFIIKFFELWGKDTEKAVECLSMLIIVFLLAIKMAICRTKRMTTIIRNIITRVQYITTSGDEEMKKILARYSRYSKKITIALTIWSFYVGLSLVAMECFLDYQEYKKLTLEAHQPMKKPIQVLYWYPFDPQKYYGLVIAYQAFTILFSDLYNSCLQSLLNTIMIQIAADVTILQYNFRNFTKNLATGEPELDEKKVMFKLRKYIQIHQQLIEQIKELDDALRSTLLIEYVVSSAMLASILVQVLSGKKPVFNSLYFGILAFQWFMLSWNANEIKLQSVEISAEIYKSGWYKQNLTTQRMVQMVMFRSQRPLLLHIGPFGEFTINAAISRFKLAYSFVSLMST